MYKVCIFDLDGTLADTIESMAYSANKVLAELGLETQPSEHFKYFAGDGAKELCKRCLRAAGDEECVRYEEMCKRYKEYFSQYCLYKAEPYEGILELLEEMKRQGKKITVLSNKPHLQAIDVIAGIFGKDCFDYVQGQMDDIPRKPDPTGALYIASKFGAEPQECLYIGDTSTDMQTGKAAGMFTIGVLWGFRTREELEEHHADRIVESPADIVALME